MGAAIHTFARARARALIEQILRVGAERPMATLRGARRRRRRRRRHCRARIL